MRAIAEDTPDDSVRAMMFDIAAEYDRHAEIALAASD
jgi:hypothetical protein